MNLDAVVQEYAPLVRSCSKPYALRYPRWRKDIEQQGMLGLVLAARRFDPSRGLKFSTFAHCYIVGLIMHFVRFSCPWSGGRAAPPRPASPH